MRSVDILDMFIDFGQEQKRDGFKLIKSSMVELTFDNGEETITYSLEDIINHFRLKKLKRLIDDGQ